MLHSSSWLFAHCRFLYSPLPDLILLPFLILFVFVLAYSTYVSFPFGLIFYISHPGFLFTCYCCSLVPNLVLFLNVFFLFLFFLAYFSFCLSFSFVLDFYIPHFGFLFTYSSLFYSLLPNLIPFLVLLCFLVNFPSVFPPRPSPLPYSSLLFLLFVPFPLFLVNIPSIFHFSSSFLLFVVVVLICLPYFASFVSPYPLLGCLFLVLTLFSCFFLRSISYSHSSSFLDPISPHLPPCRIS